MGGSVKPYPRARSSGWFFFLVLQCLVTKAFQGGKNSNRLSLIYFFFFQSPILGGFLTLYTSSSFILALHLLIMQDATSVLVSSAAFSNFLWVAATKVYYSGGYFLINAARSFSCGHLMRRWQLFLELLLHHAPMAGPQC